MRLLYRAATQQPLTHLSLIFPRTGACTDPPTRKGSMLLNLCMLERGGGGLDDAQFQARMERLGASFGCSLSTDQASLQLTSLSAGLEEAVRLVRMALLEPTWDATEFERQRHKLISTWHTEREQSQVLCALDILCATLQGRGPRGYGIDGHPTGLRNTTRGSLPARQRQLFQASEPLLAVVSNLDERTLERMLAPLLELPFTPAAAVHPWDENPSPTPSGRRITLIDVPQAATCEILCGRLSTAESSADWRIHRLIALLFGGDMNSRLMRVLRGERGLSYGASCWYDSGERTPRNRTAPFVIHVFPSAEHAPEALQRILEMYTALRDEGLSEAELERGKRSLIQALPFLRETPHRRMALDVAEALYGVRTPEEEAYREEVASLSRQDVLRVLEATHDPQALEIVLLGNAKALRPVAEALPGVEHCRVIRYPKEGFATESNASSADLPELS